MIIGIVFVVFGAFAMISVAAAAFAGHAEFGGFQDAGAVAAGIAKYAGRVPATLFALALLDAAVIGAAAVSLSTAYALGDVLSFRPSLHDKVTEAPAFYLIYVALIAIAATIVLIPGSPLGLLTNAVQVLAGVLLPSATVFLLLLSNDKAVLGPWVNTPRVNAFTGIVIAALVMLSIVLTAAVIFPAIDTAQIYWILGIGTALAFLIVTSTVVIRPESDTPSNNVGRGQWQMPALETLPPSQLNFFTRLWLFVLRGYLALAIGLVVFRVAQIALQKGSI